MNIVVGYADTGAGNAALEVGLAEATLRGAALHVRHVARIGLRNEPPEAIERMRARLAQIDQQIASLGLDGGAELRLEGREAADVLLEEVGALGAEMLVIGARRRSPVGKLVLGSTSQQLLLRAPCAVLAVKAPHEHS
ncbi:universal stress protein [Egicoccus sp. AB-alg6-2]|uniref:universal stress protein n=1 Tax=Egicoccus sp. AB-alg6-2 TaxID=3242692 RepID=UPI00359EB63B